MWVRSPTRLFATLCRSLTAPPLKKGVRSTPPHPRSYRASGLSGLERIESQRSRRGSPRRSPAPPPVWYTSSNRSRRRPGTGGHGVTTGTRNPKFASSVVTASRCPPRARSERVPFCARETKAAVDAASRFGRWSAAVPRTSASQRHLIDEFAGRLEGVLVMSDSDVAARAGR